MPLQATSGAASYDGFGGGVAAVPNYIEDVFSVWNYTGNGSTQTITNGIDLAGKGGLVWSKSRSSVDNHLLADTSRGGNFALLSNATVGSTSYPSLISSFNAGGYTLGNVYANDNGRTYASWTFRKQPKFFDVVTYTGDGNSGRTIAHSLGSTPGFMIIKSTTLNNNWIIYHRSLGYQNWMILNGTSGALADSTQWVADPTSTVFTVGSGSLNNTSGQTYVAYLYAHNAGGFGLTGTDNVISCGSFSLDSAVGVDVNLGYEAQWVMIKRTDSSAGSSGWYLLDTMRGWTVDATFGDMYLVANTTAAEAGQSIGRPTATGFAIQASTWLSTGDYIYIAIRRGPMKVPTSGTSVFDADAATTTANLSVTTNFPSDLVVSRQRDASSTGRFFWVDRLRGSTTTSCVHLNSTATSAEISNTTNGIGLQSNTSIIDNLMNPAYSITTSSIYYNFRRAPSFFDEVCYTGNNNLGRELNHNLGVTPELIIVKCRNATTDGDASFPAGWWTAVKGSGANGYWFIPSSGGGLNSNNASAYSDTWSSYFSGTTTFNPFYVTLSSGTGISGNVTGQTYVAYLFATCPGVSKVGSYTGNGSTQTINCGFTGGARFVLIKRTSTGGGDWYVWDTARGIVSGNDPHLSLNTTAAEVTTDDTIDPDSTGFIVNQLAATNVNVTSATYIFLAIA